MKTAAFLYSSGRNFNFLEKTKTGSSSYTGTAEREKEGRGDGVGESWVHPRHSTHSKLGRGRETSNASMTFHPLFGLFLGTRERKEGRNVRVESKQGGGKRKVEEIWRFRSRLFPSWTRSIGPCARDTIPIISSHVPQFV